MIQGISIDLIRPNPHQPRQNFDEAALDELAASIREHGVLQPIVVAPDGDGRYVLVAGERRWRAAKRAGMETVPVVVKDLSPQQALELALVENLQREDLNPVEEAEAFRRLRDEVGLSAEEIGRRVGKSGSYIRNKIRLLNLPEEILARVRTGELSERQAMALVPLYALPEEQRNFSYFRQIEEAVASGAPSDRLRRLVDLAVAAETYPLDDRSRCRFDPEAIVDAPGARRPTCADCDARSDNRCSDRACWETKNNYVIDTPARAASEALGIPFVPEGEAVQLRPYLSRWHTFADRAALERALNDGCGNLRLARRQTWDSAALGPEGHPDVVYVCVRSGKCTCAQTAFQEEHPEEVAAQKAAAKRAQEARGQAVRLLADAILAGRAGAMRAVAIALDYRLEMKVREAETAEALATLVARTVVERMFPRWGEATAESFRQWAERLGLVDVPAVPSEEEQ